MDIWPRWRNVPALDMALRPLASPVVACDSAGGGGGMCGFGSTLSGESAGDGGESAGGGGEVGGGGEGGGGGT